LFHLPLRLCVFAPLREPFFPSVEDGSRAKAQRRKVFQGHQVPSSWQNGILVIARSLGAASMHESFALNFFREFSRHFAAKFPSPSPGIAD
jgi:hypothetical protein